MPGITMIDSMGNRRQILKGTPNETPLKRPANRRALWIGLSVVALAAAAGAVALLLRPEKSFAARWAQRLKDAWARA